MMLYAFRCGLTLLCIVALEFGIGAVLYGGLGDAINATPMLIGLALIFALIGGVLMFLVRWR